MFCFKHIFRDKYLLLSGGKGVRHTSFNLQKKTDRKLHELHSTYCNFNRNIHVFSFRTVISKLTLLSQFKTIELFMC
jgi:hypothetical protein